MELEDELLLDDELLLELEDELLLDDELLLATLPLEEPGSGSPPPQAASRALSIPITSILRIIVVAPHVTPATPITIWMTAIGRFHYRF